MLKISEKLNSDILSHLLMFSIRPGYMYKCHVYNTSSRAFVAFMYLGSYIVYLLKLAVLLRSTIPVHFLIYNISSLISQCKVTKKKNV